MILADPDSDDNDLDMESEDDFSNVAPSDPDSDLDAYTEDENGDTSLTTEDDISNCCADNDSMHPGTGIVVLLHLVMKKNILK